MSNVSSLRVNLADFDNSYNTGITLHAISLLQDVSPSSDLDAKAQRLAEAALDRTKSLFDTTVANTAYRYWWDNTFFLHLLFEGLTEYIRVFGNAHPSTVANIKMELTRHTDYMQKYLKDDDGLYDFNPILIEKGFES